MTEITRESKLEPEFKSRLLEALRSDRYVQGRMVLRKKAEDTGPDAYCCLGVACDLLAQDGVGYWGPVDSEGDYLFIARDTEGEDASRTALPRPLVQHAGFHLSSAQLPILWDQVQEEPATPSPRSHRSYSVNEIVSLMGLNDEGYSFAQIADLIEQHL